MTPEILSEWEAHQTLFSYRWRGTMVAKKKVIRMDSAESPDLRQLIEDTTASESERQAMRKDCHLIEAALVADNIVVSGDDRARELFKRLALHRPQLKELLWVNPAHEHELVLRWVRQEARRQRRWLL